MPDYSNGKIYVIRFTDNDNHIYIGSTIQPLAVRFGGHKKKSNRSIYKYINEIYKGDWSKCYIELLEDFKCDNKEQLNKREGEIIRQYKADDKYNVLNRYVAGRTGKEYYIEQKENILKYQAEYRQANKDKIAEYHQNIIDKKQEYYKTNRNDILIKQKEYQQENKDKIAKYQAEYRQANKDKIATQEAEYYQANRDKIRKRQKEYQQANKNKIAKYQADYRQANKNKK